MSTSEYHLFQAVFNGPCRSISYASTLGVPIYIMENGIPGPPDDPKRKEWIVGCLNMVCPASPWAFGPPCSPDTRADFAPDDSRSPHICNAKVRHTSALCTPALFERCYPISTAEYHRALSCTLTYARQRIDRTVPVQVKRAIDDGYDVRGFMYWTLIGALSLYPCLSGACKCMHLFIQTFSCVALFVAAPGIVVPSHVVVKRATVRKHLLFCQLLTVCLPCQSADNFEWNFAWVSSLCTYVDDKLLPADAAINGLKRSA